MSSNLELTINSANDSDETWGQLSNVLDNALGSIPIIGGIWQALSNEISSSIVKDRGITTNEVVSKIYDYLAKVKNVPAESYEKLQNALTNMSFSKSSGLAAQIKSAMLKSLNPKARKVAQDAAKIDALKNNLENQMNTYSTLSDKEKHSEIGSLTRDLMRKTTNSISEVNNNYEKKISE